MNKQTEALKLAQDLRALADRFSEGWHDGIEIDASDIMLLSDAAEALAEQPAKEKAPQSANCEAPGWISSDHARGNDCTTEQQYPDNFIDALMYDVAKRDSEAQQAYEDAFINGTGVMLGDKRIDPASIYKKPEQEPVAVARVDDLERGGRVRALAMGLSLDAPLYTSPQPAQQQEPVSVMTVLHLKDRTEIGYGPASAGYDLPTGEYKLYTSPPASKPWVGLTDEEVKPLCDKNHIIFGAYTVDFIQAIEAKLREKNAQPSKPLTDEEIVKITADPCLYIRGGDYRIDIARAIEAAHGIKE